jgi:hypothetical protein
VAVLVEESQDAGHHEVSWNGVDSFGNQAASGVYFYRLTADSFVETKKMMLVK